MFTKFSTERHLISKIPSKQDIMNELIKVISYNESLRKDIKQYMAKQGGDGWCYIIKYHHKTPWYETTGIKKNCTMSVNERSDRILLEANRVDSFNCIFVNPLDQIQYICARVKIDNCGFNIELI